MPFSWLCISKSVLSWNCTCSSAISSNKFFNQSITIVHQYVYDLQYTLICRCFSHETSINTSIHVCFKCRDWSLQWLLNWRCKILILQNCQWNPRLRSRIWAMRKKMDWLLVTLCILNIILYIELINILLLTSRHWLNDECIVF